MPIYLRFFKSMAAMFLKTCRYETLSPTVGMNTNLRRYIKVTLTQVVFKNMAAMLLKSACLVLVLGVSLTLVGCDLRAKEDAGGIASPAEETYDNKVNPSQDADSSFLYDTSIADLTGSSAAILDEQTVQVQGEVVGDARTVDFDDEHFWITLQAEEKNKFSTITIFCTKNTTDLIDTFGSYGRRGTTLQIRGTFNLTCEQHDGLCDIHAESSTVRALGNTVSPPLQLESLAFGFTMLIFGGIMIGLYVYIAKAKRKKLVKEEAEEFPDEEED